MASTNYTGRLVDLLIFQNTAVAGDKKITLDLVGGGEVTTGIQKLVQVFTMLFLTERGSIRYKPELGTDFITAMRLGRLRDEADVQSQFALAAELVRQTLDLIADATQPPDDETFESAELQNFNLDKARSKLTMFVKVTSAAGSSREIFLPVPIAIQ